MQTIFRIKFWACEVYCFQLHGQLFVRVIGAFGLTQTSPVCQEKLLGAVVIWVRDPLQFVQFLPNFIRNPGLVLFQRTSKPNHIIYDLTHQRSYGNVLLPPKRHEPVLGQPQPFQQVYRQAAGGVLLVVFNAGKGGDRAESLAELLLADLQLFPAFFDIGAYFELFYGKILLFRA